MAFGNLCKPLCDEGKVSVIACEAMHKGKVFVATATWNGLKVVIKSYKINPSEYIPMGSNSSIEINHEEFKEMISQSLKVNFGETEDTSIHSLYPFLDNYSDDSNNVTMSKALMHNLWQLSQDSEYITLMLNKNSTHFPKGTVLSFKN